MQPPEKLYINHVPTPLGDFTVVSDGEALRLMEWRDGAERWQRHLARHYKVEPVAGEDTAQLASRVAGWFDGDLAALDGVALRPAGTAFQQTVWEHLLQVPRGTTTTYAALAEKVGLARNASRAVGTANGANPIAIAIPCHRVIGSDGKLTGYAGGIDRKHWLLKHEGAGW